MALKNVSPDVNKLAFMDVSDVTVALKNVAVLASRLHVIVWSKTVLSLGKRARITIVNLYQSMGFGTCTDDRQLGKQLIPISTPNSLLFCYVKLDLKHSKRQFRR